MMKTKNKGPEPSRGLVHCAENSETDRKIEAVSYTHLGEITMKTVKKRAAALGLTVAILFAAHPVLAADPTPTPQTEVTASFKTLSLIHI